MFAVLSCKIILLKYLRCIHHLCTVLIDCLALITVESKIFYIRLLSRHPHTASLQWVQDFSREQARGDASTGLCPAPAHRLSSVSPTSLGLHCLLHCLSAHRPLKTAPRSKLPARTKSFAFQLKARAACHSRHTGVGVCTQDLECKRLRIRGLQPAQYFWIRLSEDERPKGGRSRSTAVRDSGFESAHWSRRAHKSRHTHSSQRTRLKCKSFWISTALIQKILHLDGLDQNLLVSTVSNAKYEPRSSMGEKM
jgi:hypothetical protein